VSALRDERALARYARAIERRLAERGERPIVLSPRDWTRISGWHAAGVPLALVLESIDAAFEPQRRRARARPRSLAYVATLVDESWRVVLDGRRAPTGAPEPPVQAPPLDAWRRRLEAADPGSALHRLLDRLVRAVEDGTTPQAVDDELDRAIANAAPAALGLEATRAADGHVARLRGRMPADSIERARALARVSWLRRRLALPRLVS
jgi:hypothetical protein